MTQLFKPFEPKVTFSLSFLKGIGADLHSDDLGSDFIKAIFEEGGQLRCPVNGSDEVEFPLRDGIRGIKPKPLRGPELLCAHFPGRIP